MAIHTFDGLGRLIRTQSQTTEPDNLRSEHFYYDGVRRIQEVTADDVAPAEALMAGGGGGGGGGGTYSTELAQSAQAITTETQEASAGDEVDLTASPIALEKEQMTQAAAIGGGGGDPPPPPDLGPAREYVWGPGDGGGGLDELLLHFTELRVAQYVLQDSGGDIVALCAWGFSIDAAVVLGQWTYDAYGQCLSAQDFLGTPSMHLGHKGLFFDRLDEIAPEPGAADEPVRLIPYAHNLYHVRNRTYAPQLGRWMQRDPNATALTLAEASSHHGRGVMALAVAGFTPDDLYGDGYNLYEYLGSNPWMRSDPSGLEWDPFSMVDEFLAQSAGDRAAFLSKMGKDLKAAAIVGATILSYLPFPMASMAGDTALMLMGDMSQEEYIGSVMLGIIPGGKLMGLVAKAGKGVAGFAMKLGRAAMSTAFSYAKRAASWLADKAYGLFSKARDWVFKSCGCFTRDTLVWTGRGPIPIADVEVGDVVLARDESSGEFSLRDVTRKFIRAAAPIVVLTLASAVDGAPIELETTEEHPFLVEARQAEGPTGWVRADSLKPGDSVTTVRGFAIVRAVRFTDRLEPVYNFEVEGLHNYAVGDDGVIVHNANCFRAFTRENFNHNLSLLLPPPGTGYQAHHIIPHKYQQMFPDRNLNDPLQNGAWVHKDVHLGRGSITDEWEQWGRAHPNATSADVERFAREIEERAGLWIMKP